MKNVALQTVREPFDIVLLVRIKMSCNIQCVLFQISLLQNMVQRGAAGASWIVLLTSSEAAVSWKRFVTEFRMVTEDVLSCLVQIHCAALARAL